MKQIIKIILIAFVVITIICLLIDPIAGLVTGIGGAVALEGIERYKKLDGNKFRKFDWLNVVSIWIGTLVAFILTLLIK